MKVSSYCGGTAVLLSAHQSIGVPQPLRLYGTEEQKQRFFPRFRKGAISAFALTEPMWDPIQRVCRLRLCCRRMESTTFSMEKSCGAPTAPWQTSYSGG